MKDKYVSVSDVNRFIKIRLEQEDKLQKLFVRAEISNFKRHTRGHLYLTLKDETTRISAVMFYRDATSLAFEPEDGMKVLIEGRIGVYEANGAYQIYINKMEPDGIGNLFLKYEKLKKELAKEGLFDDKHKLPIPKYPKTIGIITASTGAAIRDILSTIKRRYPIVNTILFPSLVQGDGAKEDIVEQIKIAQEHDIDVLIVGRGGGSIEDLWAFNEEIVARAIFESKIPIISAVGHEVDFTIADFVADLRAPTPTGAAEMAVPSLFEISSLLDQYKIRLIENTNNKLRTRRERLEFLKNNQVLQNPMKLYEIKEQKLDSYLDNMNTYIKNLLANYQNKLNYINESYVLNNPDDLFDKSQQKYHLMINKLQLLNPLNILSKGYSVVKKDSKVIKDINNIEEKDKLNITLYKGNLDVIVERKNQ